MSGTASVAIMHVPKHVHRESAEDAIFRVTKRTHVSHKLVLSVPSSARWLGFGSDPGMGVRQRWSLSVRDRSVCGDGFVCWTTCVCVLLSHQ